MLMSLIIQENEKMEQNVFYVLSASEIVQKGPYKFLFFLDYWKDNVDNKYIKIQEGWLN